MNKHCLLLALVFATACNQHPYLKLDSSAFTEGRFGDFYSSVEFLPLQSYPGDSVPYVNNFLYYKGHYLIRDIRQKSLFCFDDSGNYKFRITEALDSSAGPHSIGDFTINKKANTIEIFDFDGKIIGFDLSGRQLYTRPFPFNLTEFACTAEGDYVVYSPDRYNDKGKDTIAPGAFVVDSTGRLKYRIVETQIESAYTMPENCLSGYGDSILLVSNYAPDVYLIHLQHSSPLLHLSYDEKKYSWMSNMISSNGAGSRLNILYRRDGIPNNKANLVFFDLKENSRRYFTQFRDLEAIEAPQYYQDDTTMVGFLTPAEIPLLRQRIGSTPGADRMMANGLSALSGRLSPSSPLILVKFHLR